MAKEPPITMAEILEAMRRYGGSFIVAWAQLYIVADVKNQTRLELAFTDEIIRYEEIVRQHRAIQKRGEIQEPG